jgi:hypothetical protein
VFLSLTIYSFLSAFGTNLGLAYLNYYIPGINSIRHPTRFLVLFQFFFFICLAILANSYLQEKGNLQTVRFDNKKPFKIFFDLKKLLLVILLTLGFLLNYHSLQWSIPDISSSDYYQDDYIDLEKFIERSDLTEKAKNYRVIFDETFNNQEASSFATYFGLASVLPYFQPVSKSHFNKMNAYWTFDYDKINSLGLKYAICKNCSSKLRLPQNFDNVFVPQSKIGNYELFINVYAKKYIDDFKISKDLTTIDSTLNVTSACEYDDLSKSANLIKFQLNCSANSKIVVSEYYSDYWKILVNGKEVKSLNTGDFISFNTTSLNSEVKIFYQPSIMKNSYIVFYIGLFIYLFIFFYVIYFHGSFKYHSNTVEMVYDK